MAVDVVRSHQTGTYFGGRAGWPSCRVLRRGKTKESRMHLQFFWPELGNGSTSYLMLDWERERVSGEGMRIKSFILARLG